MYFFVASRWPKKNSKLFISNSLSGVVWAIWNKLGASSGKDHPVDPGLRVSSMQLQRFATPAGVKHWQLPVITQRRTGINLPKNTFFFLVQSVTYYHVPAITKRSCWSHFAGDPKARYSHTALFWKGNLCYKWKTLYNNNAAAKGDRMMHLVKIPA